jgi:hypothetical protein
MQPHPSVSILHRFFLAFVTKEERIKLLRTDMNISGFNVWCTEKNLMVKLLQLYGAWVIFDIFLNFRSIFRCHEATRVTRSEFEKLLPLLGEISYKLLSGGELYDYKY